MEACHHMSFNGMAVTCINPAASFLRFVLVGHQSISSHYLLYPDHSKNTQLMLFGHPPWLADGPHKYSLSPWDYLNVTSTFLLLLGKICCCPLKASLEQDLYCSPWNASFGRLHAVISTIYEQGTHHGLHLLTSGSKNLSYLTLKWELQQNYTFLSHVSQPQSYSF